MRSLLNSNMFKSLWTGDVNSATSTNLTNSASNYRYFLVKTVVNGGAYEYFVMGKNIAANVRSILGSSGNPLTVYQRTIIITDSEFTTTAGIFMKGNSYGTGEYLHIVAIWGII